MKCKNILILAILVILAIGNLFLINTLAQEVKFIKIGSGSPGGTWYPQAAVLAEAINKELAPISASVSPGAAISAINMVDNNELQIAMTYAYLEGLAWDGVEPFDRPMRNVRHLVTMVPYDLTFVVRADSDIKTFKDLLKGKRIIFDAKGSIAEYLSRVVLEAHGVTYDQILANGGMISYLSYAEGAELLQDGHADMFSLMAIHPTSTLLNLSTQVKIRFLGIEEDVMEKILAESKGLIATTSPSKVGDYGITELVPAVAGPYTYIIQKDIPDELVYRITEIFYSKINEMAEAVGVERIASVTVDDIALAAGMPLHPGAEKYYQEHKTK